MGKFIFHNDGRLKTGRLSLLFFIGLVLVIGLLFNLQKPVDKAVVVVRHIFSAAPAEPKVEKLQPPAAAPAEVVDNNQKKPVPAKEKPASSVPPSKSEPVRVAAVLADQIPPVNKAEKLEPRQLQPPVEKVSEPAKPVEKAEKIEKANVEPVKKVTLAAAIKAASELQRVETTPDDKLPQIAESRLDSAATPEPLNTEELVVDLHNLYKPATPADHKGVILISDKQRHLLNKKTEPVVRKTAAVKSVKFPKFFPQQKSSSLKPESQMTRRSKPAAPETNEKTNQTLKVEKVDKTGATRSITVAQPDYLKLHHAWQNAGKKESTEDQIIPLRIENLRSAYSFLQMKAVLIRADDSCIDLTDGSRIPQASLDRFSATVIQVDDPWQKWGPQLHRAGLRPGQSFTVRYYLYDFVRRSIYARVNQAYKWSLHQGLIAPATKPDEVDVLGRTFVVRRSGGGAFGVFVPLSLKTRRGDLVKIDPVCFKDAPDVSVLHKAGLI